MGCDIHAYSESRVDGAWVCDQADSYTEEVHDEGTEDEYIERSLDSLYRYRDYWLFGLLNGGVRTDWTYSFQGRGLPDDVSELLQKVSDSWGSDGHSHNHLSLTELHNKLEELKILTTECLLDTSINSEAINHHRECLEHLIGKFPEGASPDDHRMVFWFDN